MHVPQFFYSTGKSRSTDTCFNVFVQKTVGQINLVLLVVWVIEQQLINYHEDLNTRAFKPQEHSNAFSVESEEMGLIDLYTATEL